MTEEYMKKLQDALEYQDFITDQLRKELGLVISLYSSEKRQLKGETAQGIEIKHDKLMEETGNVYIETGEKANPYNQHYVPSGIYRDDNSWLYLIGNYKQAFIFTKGVLQSIFECPNLWKQYGVEVRDTPTSQGFTMQIAKIKQRKGVIAKHLIFKED